MVKGIAALLIIFSFFELYGQRAWQVQGMPYRVVTKSGNEYHGKLHSRTSKETILLTESEGYIVIYADSIKSQRPLEMSTIRNSGQSTVRTIYGDVFKGTLIDQSDQTVQIVIATGDTISLPADIIKQVDSESSVTVNTKAGDVLRGSILSEKSGIIHMALTTGDSITLSREQVHSIETESRNDKSRTMGVRQVLRNNAIGLKKGEGYYQNVMLFANSFGMGITDYLQLNLGGVFLGDGSVLWVSPKINLSPNNEQVHVGIGGTYFRELSFGDQLLGVQGYLSLGNPNASLTAGIGAVTDSWQWYALYNIDAYARLFKGLAIMSEVLMVPADDVGIANVNLRIILKPIAIDFGGLVLFEFGIVGAVPFVGIYVPLNFKK